MEKLTSRQSAVIRRFRALSAERETREREGLFLCDGEKLLQEAVRSGASIRTVLWNGARPDTCGPFPEEYLLTEELFLYVSPMKNSPGPLFSVELPEHTPAGDVHRALVLEGVQDPGNVGTVLRTADAFGTDLVILLDGCADLYSPKTVRASMGAIFRQPVWRMCREALRQWCSENNLKLYAAALSERASDIRTLRLTDCAVAIGSEGRGLTRELRESCDEELIIPMRGEAESLNAAVAAAIVQWEMCR